MMDLPALTAPLLLAFGEKYQVSEVTVPTFAHPESMVWHSHPRTCASRNFTFTITWKQIPSYSTCSSPVLTYCLK